jgi:hypothetical protein
MINFYAVKRQHTQELTGTIQVGDTVLAICAVHHNGTPELRATEYNVRWDGVIVADSDKSELCRAILDNPQAIVFGRSTGVDCVQPFSFEVKRGPRKQNETVSA